MASSETTNEEREQEASVLKDISLDFIRALRFVVMDTQRASDFPESHLLHYIYQDFLESALAIPSLVHNGMLNVARRELRFMIEAALKLCFIQQQYYSSSVGDKLSKYEQTLDSASISIKKKVICHMINKELRGEFDDEIGRLYREISQYVHLTHSNLVEKIAHSKEGKIVGFESLDDLKGLALLVSRSLAVVLVLIFHSVPSYIAGDYFVESDGSTVGNYFVRSRFVANIDSAFDYKQERKENLETIKALRESRVEF